MVAAARADADALVGQLQREVNAATDRLAAVEALVPPECFVHRSPDLRCTDLIGGRWANGAPWTADLCCLPCRLRLALSATNLPDSSGGDHDA